MEINKSIRFTCNEEEVAELILKTLKTKKYILTNVFAREILSENNQKKYIYKVDFSEVEENTNE